MKISSIGWSLLAAALGLSLLVVLFIKTGVSFSSLEDLLLHMDAAAFVGIVICSLLYVVFGAMKWHLISGVKSPRPFFYSYFTAQAMLIGQFLPAPVAIAASRAAVMKIKQNAPLKHGFFNAVYDMGFDFLIALLLVPVSFLQWFYHFSFGAWLVIGVVMILGAGLLPICMLGFLPAAWFGPFEAARKHRLLGPRMISLLMLLSAARFAVVTLRLVLGAAALGLAIPYSIIAYATPPATMPALLFLTPANLGIAEWSWAYLFTLWGATAVAGTLFATGFRVLVLVAQLIVSGALWVAYKQAKR